VYQDQVGTLIYAVRSRVLLAVVGCAALLAACLGLPPPPPRPPSPPAAVSTCGTSFCAAGQPWSLYGSTIYNPGLTPYLSGINNPSGTIVLVNQARLNTIRITNFLDREGDPSTAPYDPTRWAKVDAMIAAASAAGLHVILAISDYRSMLWNNCIDPYTTDWTNFITFVANRVNTVTHVAYKNDPTIAFVSIAGEPLVVGPHTFTAKVTGTSCTITYTTQQLTDFYRATTTVWQQQQGSVLVNTGGLTYLDLSHSGIDWQAIFALPTVAFCDIKTYGGMLAWAPNAVTYCQSLGKPIVDEEFGFRQSLGDRNRSNWFRSTYSALRSMHFAGVAFWNLGYQLAGTSYEVNPTTTLTFAAVQSNAP